MLLFVFFCDRKPNELCAFRSGPFLPRTVAYYYCSIDDNETYAGSDAVGCSRQGLSLMILSELLTAFDAFLSLCFGLWLKYGLTTPPSPTTGVLVSLRPLSAERVELTLERLGRPELLAIASFITICCLVANTTSFLSLALALVLSIFCATGRDCLDSYARFWSIAVLIVIGPRA